MEQYHAVLVDECGDEFGADVSANTREDAYKQISEDYPESRIVQLESHADTVARERRMYNMIHRDEYDDDD